MRQIGSLKTVLVLLLLVSTGLLIHFMPAADAVPVKKARLTEALREVGSWKSQGVSQLSEEIINALDLDDYINSSYSLNRKTVSLYIGYYYSTKKIGAAHDPLVCFYGQGWVISKSGKDKVLLKSGESIPYSFMLVERGESKELVIYWFQSYDSATTSTLAQKAVSLWNRISRKPEDNAFVRITMPVTNSMSESSRIIHEFVDSFYPVLVNYAKNELVR